MKEFCFEIQEISLISLVFRKIELFQDSFLEVLFFESGLPVRLRLLDHQAVFADDILKSL